MPATDDHSSTSQKAPAVDVAAARRAEYPEGAISYTERDVILYAIRSAAALQTYNLHCALAGRVCTGLALQLVRTACMPCKPYLLVLGYIDIVPTRF